MKMILPFFLFFTLLCVFMLSSCIWDSDEKKSFCHKNPSKCYEFTDERDGQVYTWVTIGEQNWMAENLNYDTADGVGSWCYDNDPKNCEKYGRLYVWNTAMAGSASSESNPSGVQGICPVGWHVPSMDALIELLEYKEYPGAFLMKDIDFTDLKSVVDWGGTDDYGFAALPSGYYFSDQSTFWSTKRNDKEFISAVTFPENKGNWGSQKYEYTASSLRCLQD